MSKSFKLVEESKSFSHYQSNYTPVNLKDIEVFVQHNLDIIGMYPTSTDQLSIIVKRKDQSASITTLKVG